MFAEAHGNVFGVKRCMVSTISTRLCFHSFPLGIVQIHTRKIIFFKGGLF